MADPTKFATQTLAGALNIGNDNLTGAILRQLGLGTVLSPTKVTFSGLTSAAAIDITSAASFAAATINQGIPGPADVGAPVTNLPAILAVTALRVTAGTAVAGPRVVTDAGGTPAASATGLGGAPGGFATISDDGKTLTFEAAVTGFVLEYIPRTATPMTQQFVPNTKA